MKNLIAVFFIIAVLFSLTGCDAADAKPCDLSIIKIKSVVLEGDTNGLVATALKTELFTKGAKWTYDDKGVKIVGKVTMSPNGQTPLNLIVETERQPFAGIAYSYVLHPTSAANQLARRAVSDFCRCRTEGSTIHRLSFRKE